jgi:glycosyltransferase
MKLSIVTITYNNLPDLKKTLESIPREDYIESVVINGGNTFETLEYLINHRGIVINEKDSGIADAFNKGIKYSSGDTIMFLNSGDILIDKTYPETALRLLENDNNISFVHSSIKFEDPFGGELVIKPRMKNLGRGMPYLHPTMVVRYPVFEQLGGFNMNYEIAMDFDFIVRMEKQGYKGFYYDISPVVKMEGTGKSQSKEFKSIMECFTSLRENHSLSIKNILGIKVRFILYILRQAALYTGGKQLLKFLKQKKYTTN